MKPSLAQSAASGRCHLNPDNYPSPHTAGAAELLRLPGLGARGIIHRRDKTTVVICPAVELPAQVELDPDLHMKSCSRLPESQRCSESCMPQVQFSAEDLKNFAARYEGKRCASCGARLTRDDWYDSRLAIRETHTGVPRMHEAVRPWFYSIPETNRPICSVCYGREECV
jgi:hypothetical protein